MTAEIAIMNKEAIAIASDSAVTLREEKGQKIFTSANKIFALSKLHPVGVMVYGSAIFMGVPWETIIKIYRSKLGETKFDTLKEYACDFIDFLSKENQLFPESMQEMYLRGNVYGYLYHISTDIKKDVKAIISAKNGITEKEIKNIAAKVIKRHYDIWRKSELPPTIPKNHIRGLKDKYGTIIDKAKIEVFEKLPINKILSNQLTEIAVNLFVKFPEHVISSSVSGVVIAGFGTKDIFPSLQSFEIEGMANNHLKYKKDRYREITFQRNASIVPFAQQEMVFSFMEGVEPNYQAAIERDLSQIFEQYPGVIVDSIEKLNDGEKRDLKQKLREMSSGMLDQYKEKLENYRRKSYVEPVMKVVAMLPKDELAAMAESLVNLTSFKRKVSMQAETVAVPIDVAVISKGDGFIWIKRKHYFSGDLNPQFFANYYREVENEREK